MKRLFPFLVLAIWLIYQVRQSWVGTDSLAFVSLRGEDDGNFHIDLRHFTQALLQHDWVHFFHFQPHAYGWIFWLTSLIFSTPGYLVSRCFGYDSFLIASMSWMSLAFTLGGLYYFYRNLRQLGAHENLSHWLALLCLSTSFFSYTSLKWHPSAPNFFFVQLSIFYVLSKKAWPIRYILTLALLGALAAAYRMLGLLLAPALFFLLLQSLIQAGELRNSVVRKLTLFTLTYLLFFAALDFPQLFIFPNAEVWTQTWLETLQSSKMTQNMDMSPLNENNFYRFQTIWQHGYWSWPASLVFLLALGVALRAAWKRPELHPRLVSCALIAISFLLAIAFNIFIARGNPGYSINHFFPFFFLLLLPLAFLERAKKPVGYSLLALIPVLNAPGWWDCSRIYFENEANARATLSQMKELRRQIKPFFARSSQPLRILIDVEVEQFVSPIFGDPVDLGSFGDNLVRHCPAVEPFDFIVISKTSKLSISEKEFFKAYEQKRTELERSQIGQSLARQQEFLKSKAGYEFGRQEVQMLNTTGRFCGSLYRPSFVSGNYFTFQRVRE